MLDIDPNGKFVILGFAITNAEKYRQLKQAWDEGRSQDGDKIVFNRPMDKAKTILSQDLGGEVVLLDVSGVNCQPIRKISVRTPMGLLYNEKDNILFVSSDYCIAGIRNGLVIKSVNHPYFNCVHALAGMENGNMLVASTGVDAILEINHVRLHGDEFVWFATENGFNISANGARRELSRKRNYQNVEFVTSEHTTHVNSAMEFDHDHVLATFFHQGSLVKIDKRFGVAETVIDGLANPHGIRKASFGYILSDTNHGRILKFDNDLNLIGQIDGDYRWIQDAIEMQDGRFVIADANNGRIAITDSKGELIDQYAYGEDDMRIGCLLEVDGETARSIFG